MTEHARVYGVSLYDLAAEEKLSDVILEEMKVVRDVFWENPEYLRLLSEPSIKKEERLKLIDDAFGKDAQKYLVSFIKLLCERNLLGEFGSCTEEFEKRFNIDHNIAEATVTSAVPLDDNQLQALKKKLEAISGKTVSMKTSVDPKVLAGLKIELEGKQLDGTVSGRLSDISKKLDEIII